MALDRTTGMVLAAVAGMCLGSSMASAAVIAKYDFTTNSNSSDAEANSVAGVFTFNTHGVRSSGSQTAVKTYVDVTANSQATSLSANESFQFTVTPNAGYKLELSSLTFDSAVNVSAITATTFSGAFFVRSSLDNYGSDVALYTQPYTEMNYTPRTVALPGAFAALESAVTFRIYVYETGGSAQTYDGLRVDNVVLNGAVSLVPEPMSLGVLGLGSLGLLARRRGGR